LVSNAVGRKIIHIKKHSKNIGKTSGRRNIAEIIPARDFPFFIPDRVNDMLPLVEVVVVFNLIPRFFRPVRVKEKETLYRAF